MTPKSAIEQFNEIKHELPQEVREDIEKRLHDWFIKDVYTDGDDHYVKQQLRYAKEILSITN